jgi:3' terminal RNA ribose 2'-O-methyltransferase Hen1
MLLTITNLTRPATDLGFLLHKHPDAVRSVDLGFGTAHVFYPEAGEQRCTAALLVDCDPAELARRSRGGPFPLAPYVNDRPYAASSFLSVALRKMFGSALRGQSRERPGLPGQRLALSARLPALPCRGGEDLLRRLFEPLGYQVTAEPAPLDPRFPGWGGSPYFDVTVAATCRVADLLGHLYVLVPVLDDAKHYWVSADEIGKLVDGAGEWLAGHPERDLIVRRYLRHQPRLASQALAQLRDEDTATALDQADEPDQECGPAGDTAPAGDGPLAGDTAPAGDGALARTKLRDLRVQAVLAELKQAGARRVLDLGCGDGRLLEGLLRDPRFEEIVGVDASAQALERAARRLRVAEMAPRQRQRLTLLQGALTYADRRLAGYDAAVLMEVVEHVDPDRLPALEEAVFGAAAPATVVVTTPNASYNPAYPGLAPGEPRHPDHRFEWDQGQFRAWAGAVAQRHGYTATFLPVGEPHPRYGPPTQLAVLRRADRPAQAGRP